MITQKMISLKIDIDLLEELEKEVSLGYDKRNRVINRAINYYLQYLDSYRRARAIGNQGDRNGIAVAFMKRWFPHCY